MCVCVCVCVYRDKVLQKIYNLDFSNGKKSSYLQQKMNASPFTAASRINNIRRFFPSFFCWLVLTTPALRTDGQKTKVIQIRYNGIKNMIVCAAQYGFGLMSCASATETVGELAYKQSSLSSHSLLANRQSLCH